MYVHEISSLNSYKMIAHYGPTPQKPSSLLPTRPYNVSANSGIIFHTIYILTYISLSLQSNTSFSDEDVSLDTRGPLSFSQDHKDPKLSDIFSDSTFLITIRPEEFTQLSQTERQTLIDNISVVCELSGTESIASSHKFPLNDVALMGLGRMYNIADVANAAKDRTYKVRHLAAKSAAYAADA